MNAVLLEMSKLRAQSTQLDTLCKIWQIILNFDDYMKKIRGTKKCPIRQRDEYRELESE